MRLLLFSVLVEVLQLAAFGQQGAAGVRIALRNPSATVPYSGLAAIPWQQVTAAWPGIDTAKLTILGSNKQPLAWQLEYLGTGKVANLLVQVQLAKGAQQVLVLAPGTRRAVPAATYCRYVPERFEDFAWENDKIAFSAYGKALESTNENAWGIDVWSKRTTSLVIDKWYKTADYHKDYGEGLDYYKVGFTLGAGGLAALHADTLCYARNYVRWEVLDNGPLRSRFRLYHAPWQAGPATLTLVREMWIDAGSQLFTTKATVQLTGADSVELAVGIRKNNGTDAIMMDETQNLMGYWNPEEAPNGTIGVGCIFNTAGVRQYATDKHVLAVAKVANGSSFTYRAGAAWNKAGQITTAAAWMQYLLQQQASTAPIIEWIKK
ncbi:MAG: DUF4861 domain-containing protein [Chitinophagaceae bacterium]|nr:DUF4861 domain-containing protein [Chitinophagaceae bacterium]